MIIDFHTHAFPDKLAPKAMSLLASRVDRAPTTDGTVSGLLALLDKNGIDRAVVANIATNPKQEYNVNNFAIETLAEKRLYPLGSVHPDSPNIRAELLRLSEAGINGIKLHADYMEHDLDDDAFAVIFSTLCELDMFVLLHCGWDPVSPDHTHAAPDKIARVAERFPSLKIVCAHMGGTYNWDGVENLLAGKNLWLDTSLAASYGLSKEQAKRIIDKHGVDRILFASDTPWEESDKSIAYIESLGLTADEKDKIFSKNALKLLEK